MADKMGARNRKARDNSNGFPATALEDTSASGLREVQVGELFGIVWDAGFSSCYNWRERRANTPSNIEVPAPVNPFRGKENNSIDYDDIALSSFAVVVSDKLARKRMQYPHRDWLHVKPEQLSRILREHVEKGDPVDVTAFCMFLHQRASPTLKG